jgi:hypothetical protein
LHDVAILLAGLARGVVLGVAIFAGFRRLLASGFAFSGRGLGRLGFLLGPSESGLRRLDFLVGPAGFGLVRLACLLGFYECGVG